MLCMSIVVGLLANAAVNDNGPKSKRASKKVIQIKNKVNNTRVSSAFVHQNKILKFNPFLLFY